jgi:RecG-like helicase
MTDYKTCCAYLKLKKIIHYSKLHQDIYRLFENQADLSKMIFNELWEGRFGPDSEAGKDFDEHYIRHVSNGTIMKKFIRRLQYNFPHMQEELTKEIRKRPVLHDMIYPCITD